MGVLISVPMCKGERYIEYYCLGQLILRCRWWKDISSRPAWQAVKNGEVTEFKA